jgi:Ulp1 family protease
MEVSQQGNNYDCGVYTCQWMKHLAFRVVPPNWSAHDCCDFRITICLELCERGLRWADAFGTKL